MLLLMVTCLLAFVPVASTFSQRKCKDYHSLVLENLHDVLDFMDHEWPRETKALFRMSSEDEAVMEWQDEGGRWADKALARCGNDCQLIQLFRLHGIVSQEVRSFVVLTSFHRKLNNRRILLNRQIKFHVRKMSQLPSEYAQKKQEIDKKVFVKYRVGDYVGLRYFSGSSANSSPLSFVEDQEQLPCESDRNIFFVKGVVRRKKIMHKSNFVLIILITGSCHRNSSHDCRHPLAVGQTFIYSLSDYNRIKD